MAIEHVLELVQQVDQQKAASPSHARRSSVGDEVLLLQLMIIVSVVVYGVLFVCFCMNCQYPAVPA